MTDGGRISPLVHELGGLRYLLPGDVLYRIGRKLRLVVTRVDRTGCWASPETDRSVEYELVPQEMARYRVLREGSWP